MRPRTETEQSAQAVAIARLLAHPTVQRSPQMRRAVADLFEVSLRSAPTEPALRLRLGTLERLAAWATRERLRTQAMQVLETLERIPKGQRQALCARLLAHEPAALALALLQEQGWTRPSWLSNRAPDTPTDTEEAELLAWLDRIQPHESAPEESSSQLFLYARRYLVGQLASMPSAWRARALTGELLGIHFWNGLWETPADQEHIQRFYATLMNALHPHLQLVMRVAYLIATKEKLAGLAELVGLTGCLPPQLPAQLDHPAFFAAMQQRLPILLGIQENELSDEETEEMSSAQLRLRQDLRATRWRTCAFFLALAGVSEDNERRVLLAGMSLAGGKADQMHRWLEGQSLSQAEAEALLQEVRQWHHQTSITEENIRDLLRAAAEQVMPAWKQLRRAPISMKRSGG
jgi:hypothetical protein